jgi:DNA-binding NarL/FixJ family response regulator
MNLSCYTLPNGRIPSEMNKITLLVIDDHPLFRQGVIDAISLESDMKVVGQASSGDQALDAIHSLKPGIVLLDVNLPGMNGQQITHQVTLERLRSRIVLMSGYDDIEQSLHAAMAGAAAYCAKEIEPKNLVKVIREVADGKFVFGSRVMNRRELQRWIEEQVEAAPRPYSEPGSPFHPLSDREMQVLNCVVRGLSNKEIAGLLGISHQTVKNHVTSILRKFGVEDRTQAVVYALKHGWVRLRTSGVGTPGQGT